MEFHVDWHFNGSQNQADGNTSPSSVQVQCEDILSPMTPGKLRTFRVTSRKTLVVFPMSTVKDYQPALRAENASKFNHVSFSVFSKYSDGFAVLTIAFDPFSALPHVTMHIRIFPGIEEWLHLLSFFLMRAKRAT